MAKKGVIKFSSKSTMGQNLNSCNQKRKSELILARLKNRVIRKYRLWMVPCRKPNFKGRFLSEKKQMILVETESENSDDDNLQESNCPPCPSASDTPDFKVSCKATFVALSTVTSGHPYGNKRMTLVHLRQIDGN